MSNDNVIQLYATKQAKARGIKMAAYFAAERLGLTKAQCEAAARNACNTYQAGGISPARVIANAVQFMRSMAPIGAA